MYILDFSITICLIKNYCDRNIVWKWMAKNVTDLVIINNSIFIVLEHQCFSPIIKIHLSRLLYVLTNSNLRTYPCRKNWTGYRLRIVNVPSRPRQTQKSTLRLSCIKLPSDQRMFRSGVAENNDVISNLLWTYLYCLYPTPYLARNPATLLF